MKSSLLLLLTASVAGNIAFAVYTFRTSAATTPAEASASVASATSSSTPASTSASTAATTATGSKGTPGQWRTPRTDADMRNVVASLRAAGYPPSMIRAVVNQMLQERYNPDEDANLPFWKRPRQNAELVAARREAEKTIAEQREALLGADGTPAAMMSATTRERRYGALSDDKVNALIKLDEEYDEVRTAANANREQGGNGRDRRAEQQALAAEKRADLAAILSPAELEAYDMRTSQAANRVQNSLRDVDVSEEEYAQLYRIQKAHDEANPQRGELNGAEGFANRLVGQAELNAQARTVLGDERFYQYLESSDPSYGAAARFAAQQPGMTQEKTYQLYELQNEMMLSMASLRNGGQSGPPTEAQIAQMRSTAESYSARLNTLLGAEAAAAYRKQGGGRMFNAVTQGARRFNRGGN